MRYLTPAIQQVLREEEKMVFIAGPRQVGKTTLVRSLLSETGDSSRYFNWDNDTQRKLILRSPESFWKLPLKTSAAHKTRFALDEIHKYPRWKRFLKGLFDVHRQDIELLVTGSGRLDLYQKGGDSLFGRYALFHLHPFTLGEILQKDRNSVLKPEEFRKAILEKAPTHAETELARLERFSGFPEPLFAGSMDRLERWRREHHRLVIREDLRDLTRIREIGLIESLLMLLPERVGSPLSINSLREDLNVAFDTVQTWIEALQRLYYLFEIRPYAGRLARSLRREGKIYFFDFTEVEDPGSRFENVVAVHLLKLVDAWNDWGYGDFNLHYVRTKEKKESDFLITNHHKPYILFEAKLSDRSIDPSLFYFHERLKPAYSVQITRQKNAIQDPHPAKNVFHLSAAQVLSRI